MKKEKIIIDISHKHTTVLLGNGICRCIGMDSCDGIIEEIRKENNPSADPTVMKKLMFPQKIVVATNDHVDVNMKRLTKNMVDVAYSVEDTAFLNQLLKAMPEAILTANYSTELETASFEKYTSYVYNNNVKKACDLRMTAENLGLNTYIPLSIDGEQKLLWHIHGNAMRPKSVIMGHYYYGKLLREIEEYIPGFMRRYQIAKKTDQTLQIKSWVDYFLICDVHIIGFSMDPAEMDLWWLLCCKKRHFPETTVYFYEPSKEYINGTGKDLLLTAYGAEIVTEKGFKGDYKQFYLDLVNKI